LNISEQEKILSEEDAKKVEKNSQTKISEFKKNKLEIDARRHWDIFYKNNTSNFFKDRNFSKSFTVNVIGFGNYNSKREDNIEEDQREGERNVIL